jgi:hypothetical protein
VRVALEPAGFFGPDAAPATLGPGLADGLGDRLDEELGLAFPGLEFELGEGLEDGPDVPLGVGAAVTVGPSWRAAVVAALALVVAAAADVVVFFAGCVDPPDGADVETGGQSCVEQGIMTLRLTPLLAVSRITTTASAVTRTVGKMTAQK